MVDDGKVLLDNSGADMWVVQQNTLGPYAESSSINDDIYRMILAIPGVERAANVTYLTMQVRKGTSDVRSMVVGVAPGDMATPGRPPFLVAGRHITRSHYEAVADIATGFSLGDRIVVRRNHFTVVGLTRRTVSSGGDPMVFIPLKDAQEAQFLRITTPLSVSAGAPVRIPSSIGRAFPACWTPSSPRKTATLT